MKKTELKEVIICTPYIGTAYKLKPSVKSRCVIYEKGSGLRFDPEQITSHRIYGEFYSSGKSWKGYIRKENSPQAYKLSLEVMKRNGNE